MSLAALSTQKTDSDESKVLARNLSVLLKEHGRNANSLAQILDIPMMTIRRLLSGETANPRISTLKLLADHFHVSVDALMGRYTFDSYKIVEKNQPRRVPQLDWRTAEKVFATHEFNSSNWEKWQAIVVGEQYLIGKNAFALESRPSMYPRFPHGTIFIVDPDTSPTDGDIVLVRLKENRELTLRELVIDSPEWQLHPVTPGASVLQFSKHHHELVGVSLLTLFYNKRIYE